MSGSLSLAINFPFLLLFLFVDVTPTSTLPRVPTTGILRPPKDKDEDRLFRDLFQDYNQELRPAVNKEENVTVFLGLTLQQVIDLVRNILSVLPFFKIKGWKGDKKIIVNSC